MCDKALDNTLDDYDIVVLPGGYGGADAMRDNEQFQACLKAMNTAGKYIAAICAAPIALDKAGVLQGKNYTCYPETKEKIATGTYLDENVVVDGNDIPQARILRGPGAARAGAAGRGGPCPGKKAIGKEKAHKNH